MKRYVVGIDEAGRGPLAGPITVAAVAVPSSLRIFRGIKDSKKLNIKKREEWFSNLSSHPKLKYSVASVGPAIIDRRGISFAAKLAVKRCIKKLEKRFKIQDLRFKILLDGSLFAPSEYFQETIIKGDEKIPIIAAASIVAKVTRDKKMVRLAKKFPEYDFHVHKGYGTRLHRRLVKKYGLCDIHRRSFCSRLA